MVAMTCSSVSAMKTESAFPDRGSRERRSVGAAFGEVQPARAPVRGPVPMRFPRETTRVWPVASRAGVRIGRPDAAALPY
jgi:hypothetical protein